MDGCKKILNHQKNSENTENQSLLKSKSMLQAKYRLSGISIYIFSMPEGHFIPLPPYPISYATASEVFPLLFSQFIFFNKIQMFLRNLRWRAHGSNHWCLVISVTDLLAERIWKKIFCWKTHFCNIFRSPHIHHYIGRLHDLRGCSIWRIHGKCIRRMGRILRRNWPENSLHVTFFQTELWDLHKWFKIRLKFQSIQIFYCLAKKQDFKLCTAYNKLVKVFVKLRTTYKSRENGPILIIVSRCRHGNWKTFWCTSARFKERSVFFKSVLVCFKKFKAKRTQKQSLVSGDFYPEFLCWKNCTKIILLQNIPLQYFPLPTYPSLHWQTARPPRL